MQYVVVQLCGMCHIGRGARVFFYIYWAVCTSERCTAYIQRSIINYYSSSIHMRRLSSPKWVPMMSLLLLYTQHTIARTNMRLSATLALSRQMPPAGSCFTFNNKYLVLTPKWMREYVISRFFFFFFCFLFFRFVFSIANTCVIIIMDWRRGRRSSVLYNRIRLWIMYSLHTSVTVMPAAGRRPQNALSILSFILDLNAKLMTDSVSTLWLLFVCMCYMN